MHATAGPESAREVEAMIDEVTREQAAKADPEWQEKYGENLADYTRDLFGV